MIELELQMQLTGKWIELNAMKESKQVKPNGWRLEEAHPLHLFISRLIFDHHWLFNEEQILHERTCASWRKYVLVLVDKDADTELHARKMAALYQAIIDFIFYYIILFMIVYYLIITNSFIFLQCIFTIRLDK